MTAQRGRIGRAVARTLRTPAVLDRRGLRWMLRGLSPVPIVILVHRGRRSGRIYKTPVEAIVDDREHDEIVVSPMWGERGDWYRNVTAGGLVEVRRKGEGQRVESRRLSEDECREAIATYRSDHPIYSRVVLRMLGRIHDLPGDPVEAMARELPMLALRPTAAPPAPTGNHE